MFINMLLGSGVLLGAVIVLVVAGFVVHLRTAREEPGGGGEVG